MSEEHAWAFDEPELRTLIHAEAERGCLLRPCAYFVAWNGVLTLVYTGFPPLLAKVKAQLNEPVHGLKPENFGSKWPKTTLGALNDDASPLTLDDLTSLRKLCEEHARGLTRLVVPVEALSFVAYKQRGLEPVESRRCSHVELRSPSRAAVDGCDDAEPAGEEQARVRGVLDEWSDMQAYLERVNAPGSRIGSYREASPEGSTLVAFLGSGTSAAGPPSEVGTLLAAFRSAVDALLPGRYSWLDDSSLHCTVRALADRS